MQVLAVVTLNHSNAKPEDKMVNTFCFEYPGPDVPATDAAIASALTAFYNNTPAGGNTAVGSYINDSIIRSTNGCFIHLYSINNNLGGTPHGSPLAIYTFTLRTVTGAGAGMPAEVAAVLSFHANYGNLSEEVGGTRPKNRRRGRVYIGPLTLGTVQQDGTTKRNRLATAFQTDLVKAGQALMDDSNTNWCVWSRRDQLTLTVIGGHVDDAFDTQRRRGEKTVIRSTYGV